jgi:hypothetical protein
MVPAAVMASHKPNHRPWNRQRSLLRLAHDQRLPTEITISRRWSDAVQAVSGLMVVGWPSRKPLVQPPNATLWARTNPNLLIFEI